MNNYKHDFQFLLGGYKIKYNICQVSQTRFVVTVTLICGWKETSCGKFFSKTILESKHCSFCLTFKFSFKNLPFCRRFESNLNLQGTAVPWERIANTVPDLNQLFVCFFYLSVTQIDKMNRWLRNNELGGPIPDVFGTLPNLQILYCLFWLFCGVGF